MDYSVTANKKRIKRYKSPAKKLVNKVVLWVLRIFIAAVLIAVFAGGAAVLGAYLAIINDTPVDFEYFVIEPNKYSTKIVDRAGNEIGSFRGEENRENVEFEQVPENLKNAIIAIEDERFYSHNGIDLRSIARSIREVFIYNNLQGASTITQQLIKMNITKVTRNSLESKLKEQYIAIKYEEFLTEKLGGKQAAKDYILSVYMNSIPMHHGLYGISTAANYYFGKDVSELTLSEAAVLAGITNNPSKYAPDTRPENNEYRQGLILDKMLELEFITEAQYNAAKNDDVYARVGSYALKMEEADVIHTFYEDQIFESLLSDLQDMGYDRITATNLIYNGGLVIESAQDFAIQKIVDDAYLDDSNFPSKDFEIDVLYAATIQNTVTGQVRNVENKKTVKTMEDAQAYVEAAREGNKGPNDTIQYDRYDFTPQPQSAFSIIDYHTGQVKAIAGGRGEKISNRTFNRATKATRSPGSTFKVLASYAPAIDMGLITPATTIVDAPFMVGTYAPVNWYGGYRGAATVRQGITNSMNVITVKNMYNTGVDNCFDYLLKFGFTTLVDEVNEFGQTDRGLPTALGGLTNGVTQTELAAAYGTIANEGYYNKPVFYTKVYDRQGDLLIDNTPAPKQVLKKTSAYLLTDMLKGVLTDAGSTGGKARFTSVKMPIAGKTGTSSDDKDLMFAGFTPYYVASIWIGFDIQKPIEGSAGSHLLLWSKIMEEIHKDLPYKDFPKPDGIVTASVCSQSGLLPVPNLCGIRTEIFDVTTVPTEYCNSHNTITICTVSDMIANEYCPADYCEEVSGVRRGFGIMVGDVIYSDVCNVHNLYNASQLPGGLPSDLDVFAPPAANNTSEDLSGYSSDVQGTPAAEQNNQPEMPAGLPVDIQMPVPEDNQTDLPAGLPIPTQTPSQTDDLPPVPEYRSSDYWRQ